MGRGKKRWFGGCDVLGGWVVYCSITGKCFMSKLECLRKKNCLNILFEITGNTFNKVCGDGVGLGWSEVRGLERQKMQGRGRENKVTIKQ